MPIDLSYISLADEHCHGIYRKQGPMDIKTWRQHFTESHDHSMCDNAMRLYRVEAGA